MHRSAIVFLHFLLSVSLFAGFVFASGLRSDYPPISADFALEQALLSYTNSARRQAGLSELKMDEHLAIAARAHARDMATLNYLSHESPNPETATLALRVAKAGSVAQMVGENLAFIPDSNDLAQATVNGWLESPGHRANILEPNFSHVGFGIASDGKGNRYLAQVFSNQPLELAQASVMRENKTVYKIKVKLDIKEPREVALFYGEDVLEPRWLEPGRRSLEFSSELQESLHLRAGSRLQSKGFILQDEGWLQLATNRWQESSTTPKNDLSIADVSAERQNNSQYRVRLEFAAPPAAALAVWVAGQYQEVQLRGAELSLAVPADLSEPVIDIGLQQKNQRFAIVMRLKLATEGLEPELVPYR